MKDSTLVAKIDYILLESYYYVKILSLVHIFRVPVKVPAGLAVFPEELVVVPKPLAEYSYKVN